MTEATLKAVVDVLNNGGVIAYPTEHCFGLGCDPDCLDAVHRILKIKERQADQGLIMIGYDQAQLSPYANFDALSESEIARVQQSWPGPNTWLVPAQPSVSPMVRGVHTTIAVRVPAFAPCRKLLLEFGKPIISTSANRHGQAALLSAAEVREQMQEELDYVWDLPVGGAASPSTIRDARSGAQLR